MEAYKPILIEIINTVDKHKKGRKNKFTVDVYIDYIFRIFFYGESWNTFYCPNCDRSTIRKKHDKWRKMGIYKIAHEQLLNKYIADKTFNTLFIDSTIHENSNCSSKEMDYYYKIKTKKQIKTSIICDSNRVPLVYQISDPTINDSKFIKPLIKKINVKLDNKTLLVGDKGYISRQIIFKRQRKRIKLVCPKRKNQKNRRLTEQEKQKLKDRFVVEATFSHLKKTYRRLKRVEERHLLNFETFFIMGISCQLIRALK